MEWRGGAGRFGGGLVLGRIGKNGLCMAYLRLTIWEALESPETKERTDRVRDALNDLDYVISRAYFTIGFRWGARMALSILSDESDLFVPEA